jgi:hypothetical protein
MKCSLPARRAQLSGLRQRACPCTTRHVQALASLTLLLRKRECCDARNLEGCAGAHTLSETSHMAVNAWGARRLNDTQHAARHWIAKLSLTHPNFLCPHRTSKSGKAQHVQCLTQLSTEFPDDLRGERTSTRDRSGTATRARAAGSRRRAARRRAAASQGQGQGPGPARRRRGGRRTRRAPGRCRTTAGGPGSTASARLRARGELRHTKDTAAGQ